MAAPNPKDVRDLNELLVEQNRNFSGINKKQKQAQILAQQRANIEKAIADWGKEYTNDRVAAEAAIKNLNSQLDKVTAEEERINKELNKQVKSRKITNDLVRTLNSQLKAGWKYLQDQDKIIKSVTLNLGMSNAKAAAMRESFKASAGDMLKLGGSMEDIAAIMQTYADETGKARVLTTEMVNDIAEIGRGTGLSVAEAAKLGAQFELMGFDAKSTANYVQGVVDTSERMGVNTTKVLKVVNDNFKRLNTYTFQQGVKGFAQMAMYAEKFKIDINQALNAADVARSLEGAIDLAAQLQIMGGEFAKTDPFEMLFLSRNDPAKFTEKIADMTKGIVSFRKMADGTFEKFISPADRDRIAAVAKSMGMEAGALTEIVERQAEISKIRQQMGGLGLSAEEKKAVEGAYIYNKETGKFQVQVGKELVNVRELTKQQAETFKIHSDDLKKRATEALTFSETFNKTIEILKSTLLPLLGVINEKVLPKLGKIADKFIKFADQGTWGMIKAAGLLMAPALIFKTASTMLGGAFAKGGGAILSRVGNKGTKGLAEAVSSQGSKSGLFEQRKGIGMGKAAKGAGLSKAGTGAAAAGIGAGIMMAAKGIGDLAQGIKDVDVDKLKTMNATVAILGGTFTAILIPAMFALGAAGPFAALGLAAVGAAAVGIGFGVNLATEGISKMAKGIATMNESGTGAGKQLLGVAAGVGAITLAMVGGGVPALFAFNNALNRMDRNSKGVEKIGAAFKSIHAVLSGNRDDFEAIEKTVKSIGSANVKGGGYFAELANLLKKPLQVEFANNGRVSMTNDITLNLDGKTFMEKSYDVNIAVQKHESLKHGKGS